MSWHEHWNYEVGKVIFLFKFTFSKVDNQTINHRCGTSTHTHTNCSFPIWLNSFSGKISNFQTSAIDPPVLVTAEDESSPDASSGRNLLYLFGHDASKRSEESQSVIAQRAVIWELQIDDDHQSWRSESDFLRVGDHTPLGAAFAVLCCQV